MLKLANKFPSHFQVLVHLVHVTKRQQGVDVVRMNFQYRLNSNKVSVKNLWLTHQDSKKRLYSCGRRTERR